MVRNAKFRKLSGVLRRNAVNTASEKVGKGIPPEASKWRPGQSGNPSGRPSEPHKVLVQAVKDMLAEIDPKLKKSMFERLIEQAGRRALQGSFRHLELLFAYGLGKPIQQAVNINHDIAEGSLAAAIQMRRMSDEELAARLMELTSESGPVQDKSALKILGPEQPVEQQQPAKPEPPPVAPRALTPLERAKQESERVQAEAEPFLRNDPITKLCGRGSTKPN
jgi:uncharacterized protein DUF5681